MIIIWGEYNKQNNLGMVADYCGQCLEVTRFKVVDHRRVSHVYYIPSGNGTRIMLCRTCCTCDITYECKKKDYAEILPMIEGREMPIGELLLRTNPVVFNHFNDPNVIADSTEPAEAYTAELEPRDPNLDPQYRQANQTIAAFQQEAWYPAIRKRLDDWNLLSYAQRARLTEEIQDCIVPDQQRKIAAIAIELSQHAPKNSLLIGLIIGGIIGLLPLAILTVAMMNEGFQLEPFIKAFIVFPLSLLISAIGVVTFRQNRWLNRQFIPAMLTLDAPPAVIYRTLLQLHEQNLTAPASGLLSTSTYVAYARVALQQDLLTSDDIMAITRQVRQEAD